MSHLPAPLPPPSGENGRRVEALRMAMRERILVLDGAMGTLIQAQNLKAADGRAVNDHVEWVGGGASTTMLGGLKAGKFDAIMAVPGGEGGGGGGGVGRALYDNPDGKTGDRGVGGAPPGALALRLAPRPGALQIDGVEVAGQGAASRELLECAQQVLLGRAIAAPDEGPGRAYRLAYALE